MQGLLLPILLLSSGNRSVHPWPSLFPGSPLSPCQLSGVPSLRQQLNPLGTQLMAIQGFGTQEP